MGFFTILALWLSVNILRVNTQETEQLMANAQEFEIKEESVQQLPPQIIPLNSDTLKDSWIILLIEVSAYGLLYEYANKLLGPDPNERKPNFTMVNAEYCLQSEAAKKILDPPLN